MGSTSMFVERKTKGEFNTLLKDLMLFDHLHFSKSFCMTPTSIWKVTFLDWSFPIFKSSKIRDVTLPSERLCIKLRYLSTGDARATLASSYRVSPPVVGRIIYETCHFIWEKLQENRYLNVPNSEEDWRKISRNFELNWNFPHCLGAIDGKHVVKQAPPHSGSDYFNYGVSIKIANLDMLLTKIL